MKIVELTEVSGMKFFMISNNHRIYEGANNSAILTDANTLSSTPLKDKYSDLIHLYGVTTNPRVKRGK